MLELGKVVDNDVNEFLEFMAKKKKSRTTIMKIELDWIITWKKIIYQLHKNLISYHGGKQMG